MSFKDYLGGSLNPLHILHAILFKIAFIRNNPDYFDPAGIWVFCGPQGCGKTLSAVQCLQKLNKMYPKALIVSNLAVKGLSKKIIPFVDYSQITQMSNGTDGIIFFLDEIHVLWNSLESKDIPISEMASFCQMRKNRRVIIGTSQVYSRIAKPIREQLQYIVNCRNFFQLVQFNTLLDPCDSVEHDGSIGAKIIGRHIFFHRPALYKSYDTLKKIVKPGRKGAEKRGTIRH